MKFLPLVWAMLWRSRARTWLTFLSIVVAFVLFAVLRTLESGFYSGVRIAGDDRLIVTFRQGLTNVLPYAYRGQIQQVGGVRSVQGVFPFGVVYQDPKNQIPGVALDHDESIVYDPRVIILPEHVDAWRKTRDGVLVGRDMAENHGWKVGDRLPVTVGMHRKDGSQHWEFQIVGFWEYDEKVVGRKVDSSAIVARYDYFNDLITFQNYVLWYAVTIEDPEQATAVGREIDGLFLNSQFPTRTQRESEFQASFIRQIGDIGAVITGVLAAVFFTLVLVAGNAMMQAFGERIPELGVLKTLGFSDARLAVLAIAEALLLCLGAAGAGLAISAYAVEAAGNHLSIQGMRLPGLEAVTVYTGLALAMLIGLAASLIPAWKSARLSVIDAFAEQT